MPSAPLIVRLNARTFPMPPEEREILAVTGGRLVEIEGDTDEEILAVAPQADAVMIVSAYLRAPVVRQLTRCRIISRLGTGVDKIDVEEATRQGILVTNLPDFCTEEVADHTLALLLAAARQLKHFEAEMRRGRQARDAREMHRLATRTLGLVGFGRIGHAVARRALAFGMTVLASDPALTPEQAAAAGIAAADLETVLSTANYLCLLCPLLPSTRGLLDLRAFRLMKPTAILINTGRGELVVEEDLSTALREGLIRYAALDVYAGINVFAPEGFPTTDPFFSLDNVLLTPHVAALSQESLLEQKIGGARAVVDVLSGRWPAHPVNPEVLPRFPLERSPQP